MIELVLATSNPHKVEELSRILSAEGLDTVRVLSLADVGGGFPEPRETGETFETNAGIKAVAYARATGRVCLADDSGLEIDALGGRPGVISSHYCTDGREAGMSRAERDEANNARVLREMKGVPAEQRSARFVCVMAVARPLAEGSSELVFVCRGTMEGRIGVPPEVPRGAHGFGYDPLFLVVPEFSRTGAELSPDEKSRLSHRGVAGRTLAEWLRSGGLG